MIYFYEKHFMNKKKNKKSEFSSVNTVILCLFPMPCNSFHYIYRKELFFF